MLLRLLQTPLFDVLLIILLLRIFFPSLFGVKRKAKAKAEKERTTLHNSASSPGYPGPKYRKEEGEYVDYEEIK